MKKISIILILISFLLSSCIEEKSKFIIHNQAGVAEIPFELSSAGHIIVKSIIKGDTLNFLLDTGSNLTIISSNVDDDGFLNDVSGIDIHNKLATISICNLKLLQLPDVDFKDIVVGKVAIPIDNVDGIIGRDLLKNFCLKIDNENKRILLSENSRLINKKGLNRQFNSSLNTIAMVLVSDSVRVDFLFDTGYIGEVSIDSLMLNLQTKAECQKKWWKTQKSGIFRDGMKFSSSAFFPSDINLDSITFKNVVFEYNESIRKNIIGNAFMNRFKSIVFDYLNDKAFFELPDDKSVIGFSGNQIKNASILSLNLYFERLNSLGVEFNLDYPFVVSSILKRKTNSTIGIGDTLVGIDNVLFSEKLFNRKNKTQYYLELDTIAQRQLIRKTLHQSKEAKFLFIKHNEIIPVNTCRNVIRSVTPAQAYSYFDNKVDLGYYAICFAKELGSNLLIHIPFSTLSGEEIKISTYKKGKEEVLSNNPEEETEVR